MIILEIRNAFFPTQYSTREENGKKYIDGYFIVYGQETELWRGFYEEIAPGACRESIENNDIRVLYNHNHDLVLGRKQSGTAMLREDDIGVHVTVEINENDTEALNIYQRAKRGDVTGASFGFYIPSGGEKFEDSNPQRIKSTITKADVFEVSVCPFPAYPQTEIHARKQFIKEQKDRIKNAERARFTNVLNGTEAKQR